MAKVEISWKSVAVATATELIMASGPAAAITCGLSIFGMLATPWWACFLAVWGTCVSLTVVDIVWELYGDRVTGAMGSVWSKIRNLWRKED